LNRRLFLQSAASLTATTTLPPAFSAFAEEKTLGKGETTRMGWFQLRFTDAKKDPAAFAQAAAELNMNAICVTFGGCLSYLFQLTWRAEWPQRRRPVSGDPCDPALSPGRVLLAQIPLGQTPSLHLLRRRLPGLVRRLPRCRVGGGALTR